MYVSLYAGENMREKSIKNGGSQWGSNDERPLSHVKLLTSVNAQVYHFAGFGGVCTCVHGGGAA